MRPCGGSCDPEHQERRLLRSRSGRGANLEPDAGAARSRRDSKRDHRRIRSRAGPLRSGLGRPSRKTFRRRFDRGEGWFRRLSWLLCFTKRVRYKMSRSFFGSAKRQKDRQISSYLRNVTESSAKFATFQCGIAQTPLDTPTAAHLSQAVRLVNDLGDTVANRAAIPRSLPSSSIRSGFPQQHPRFVEIMVVTRSRFRGRALLPRSGHRAQRVHGSLSRRPWVLLRQRMPALSLRHRLMYRRRAWQPNLNPLIAGLESEGVPTPQVRPDRQPRLAQGRAASRARTPVKLKLDAATTFGRRR